MAKRLHFPSAQHAAQHWRENPQFIANALVRLFENPPIFNYNALNSAVRDLLVLKVPYDQVKEGIRRGVKRKDVRDNFLEILPMIRDHFDGVNPDFVNTVSERRYQLGRGLFIPFRPPLLYGVGGEFVLPWFVFWRKNRLMGERLSLFISIVQEIMCQDPDLDEARIEILDFSVPRNETSRCLTVTDAKDLPALSEDRKLEMIRDVVVGFSMAEAEIARKSNQSSAKNDEENRRPDCPDQPNLF